MLGLETPRQSQAVNLGWLLLVPGLGLTEASCCLFERIYKVIQYSQDQLFIWKKQLGWANNLGEAESGHLHVGSNSVTVLARLIESQIRYQPALWLCRGRAQKRDNGLCSP